VSRSISGATDTPGRSADALLNAYLGGLREVDQDVQIASQDGWARLERFAAMLADWFGHSDWPILWAAMTPAQGVAVDDPQAAKALECRGEESRLLNWAINGMGVADTGALLNVVQIIVFGSQIAAALDGPTAAGTLRGLLAWLRQEQERAAGVGVDPSPGVASGGLYAGRDRLPRPGHALV
jgi:hypothetical protein